MSAVVTRVRTSLWRVVLRWLPTFLGFVGPVDALAPALAGGAITGAVLGAAQSWGLAPNGPSARRWIVATSAGFALGLAAGATLVDHATDTGALAVQGAVCGVAVGAAQAWILRSRLGALALAWVPWTAALWALGWTITATIGVDVEARYTVFGSSGALTVTVLSAVLPVTLALRARGAR